MKNFWRVLYGAFFVFAGIMHFVRPEFYLRIVPPYLPFHEALVQISGAAEIGIGLLLCVPRTSRFAAWSLILLLLAIFPANIHAALNPETIHGMPEWAGWARLPLQFILIHWAYQLTK